MHQPGYILTVPQFIQRRFHWGDMVVLLGVTALLYAGVSLAVHAPIALRGPQISLVSTEAAEVLGFATVAQGDITLTTLGETFAEASILARKEIFVTRIRRLPLFQWLLAMLHAAEAQQLHKDVVSTVLARDFPPEEAARQVEVAINWGRYAERLSTTTKVLTNDGILEACDQSTYHR